LLPALTALLVRSRVISIPIIVAALIQASENKCELSELLSKL
jgi:hypothetical protein